MNETEIDINEQLKTLDVEFSFHLARDEYGKGKLDGRNHWAVTLSNSRSSYTTEYNQGAAYRVATKSDSFVTIGGGHTRHYRKGERLPMIPPHCGISLAEESFLVNCTKPAEPNLADVLYCLVSDAQCAAYACNFEDFAAEFGYDSDSREAERIYKACQDTHYNLMKLGLDLDELSELFQDY